MTEVLHWGALVPLGGAVAFRRCRVPGAVLIGAAFAVSFVGDALAEALDGVWFTSYLWLPVQLGLVFCALVWRVRVLYLGLAALAFVSAFDVIVLREGPEFLLTVAGGAGIVWLNLRNPHPLAAPLLLYFGVGSALYLAMIQSIGGASFEAWWWAYQGARVSAWLAFLGVLWKSP